MYVNKASLASVLQNEARAVGHHENCLVITEQSAIYVLDKILFLGHSKWNLITLYYFSDARQSCLSLDGNLSWLSQTYHRRQLTWNCSKVLQPGFSSMPVSIPVNSFDNGGSNLDGHQNSQYQMPISPGGQLSVNGSSPRPSSVNGYVNFPSLKLLHYNHITQRKNGLTRW